MEGQCQICGVTTPDIRHLTINCSYLLVETFPKFEKVKFYREDGSLEWAYSLRVCKGCRSVFMFNYLKHFIAHGAKLRKELGIDEDGIAIGVKEG